MIKAFFNTLSYIFHPIFLSILGLYFLFNLPASSPGLIQTALFAVDPHVQKGIYLVFGTLMVLAPGISILIMFWSRLIKSAKMETQLERSYSLGIMLAYAVLCYYFLRVMILDSQSYHYILIYVFAIILSIGAGFILNLFIKVSLHALGIFGLVGAVIGYFNNHINVNLYFIFVLILIAGLVCSGRLFLKAHKTSEVLLGMVFGFSIEFLCMKFEWFI